jgi:hypothetical protein
MSEEQISPKVFMSYSWTDEDHIAWVESLATRLMSDGVHVIFDQWDLKKGHDKIVFMEQMVTDPGVKRVLCVCDRLYSEKADGRRGGVGTESQIISKELYDRVTQEKVVALLREKDDHGEPCLPVFFRARMYYDFCDDDRFEEEYESLLRDMLDAPKKKRPALGKPPAHITNDDAIQIKTASVWLRLKDALSKGKPQAKTLLQEYLLAFTDALNDFRITYDRTPNWDEQVVASIGAYLPYRDNFIDCMHTISRFMPAENYADELHEFLEQLLAYQHRPAELQGWSEVSFDNYRFIQAELFLTLVAILIGQKQYELVAQAVDQPYFVKSEFGGSEEVQLGIFAFQDHIKSLDEIRKHRLKLPLISVTGDLIRERATDPRATFQDLRQADFILYMRPFFVTRRGSSTWYPRLIGYARGSGTLPLFTRATSQKGFHALSVLFEVKTLDDLVEKIGELLLNPDALRIFRQNPLLSASIPRMLNLEELRRFVGKA